MKRRHDMPFGAVAERDGEGRGDGAGRDEGRGDDAAARFGLWAPAADTIEVVFETPGRERRVALDAGEDGWFSGRVPARPGETYRFALPGDERVPDPASRFQPEGPLGASELVDPTAFDWPDAGWRGRPFEEAVFYELHVGAFSASGDYAGVVERLGHLVDLGVTALELMPLASCPGARNWGYDGVLPYAPDAVYGRPDALKALVAAAHGSGLMVFLDVVYNHFGPEGNFLRSYAPGFFTSRHHTPWGDAIDFDGPTSRPVREYFIHNALYWLEEYHLDGLRLDAVHAIRDDSEPDILEELAARVHAGVGRERHVHLVLENDGNEARRLGRDASGRPTSYTAQWNDDLHHAFHVLLTGEREGYYVDYADAPARHLGRCLAEGFAYQGEPSLHRDGALRGEPSAALPPTAFVGFIQNHDQIGNRAFGERIHRLAPADAIAAATLVLLLSPSPPLLFMGEEWAADEPFLFFCDFDPPLDDAVRDGRRREFERFPAFRDPSTRERIPDPCAEETFVRSRLRWEERRLDPHREVLEHHRRLLAVRHREIVPRLAGPGPGAGSFEVLGDAALRVRWRLGDGATLTIVANLGQEPVACAPSPVPGQCLAQVPQPLADALAEGRLPAACAGAWLAEPDGRHGRHAASRTNEPDEPR